VAVPFCVKVAVVPEIVTPAEPVHLLKVYVVVCDVVADVGDTLPPLAL
jgi:hypothetical protein